MDALIFDFDGVVVDSEPIHLIGFRQELEPLGIDLTTEAYYQNYLGYDDHDCFVAALGDHGQECSEEQIAQMTASKSTFIQQAFAESIKPIAGVVSLINRAAKADVPMGICSGGLRKEIELAARCIGVLELFSEIISAEDVRHGKPDPEGFRKTLAKMSEKTKRELASHRCVAIEDSPAGISAAKAAGMKVLAVTNSYPVEKLQQADRIVDSLANVTVDSLDELL